MKTVEIDGNSFDDVETFYDEVERKICPDFKGFGRNLDAFNDVLVGGFGMFEYEEPITIVWQQSAKSKQDLSYPETIKHLERMRQGAHPTNFESIDHRIAEAHEGRGSTLFDDLIGIMKRHQHITLVLK